MYSVDKTVKIKDFVFGDGTPRICVPIIGRTGREIFDVAVKIRKEVDRLDEKYKDYPELRVAVL